MSLFVHPTFLVVPAERAHLNLLWNIFVEILTVFAAFLGPAEGEFDCAIYTW